MRTQPARYYLNDAVVQTALDRANLTHKEFARHLGISRAHWSVIFNRWRRLTPMVRQLLVRSKYLTGIAPDDLWDVERPEETAAMGPAA